MSRRRRTRASARHRVDEATSRFEAFLAEEGNALFRLAVVLTSDVRTGEDLYQETLERLARHWAGVDNPAAWSRRVMHNLAIDRLRAKRSRPDEVFAPAEAANRPDSVSNDPLAAVELRPALFRALADLSEVQRLVVALRFLEDRSEADVARLLDMPVGTVKSTTSRAVGHLRRHPSLTQLFFDAEATG